MKRNHIETVLGAVVIVIAVIFFGLSYSTAGVGSVKGYEVTADFTGIGGLGIGDSVQISGVKIGSVSKITLNPETYQARVTLSVDNSIKLPDDTAALISSESLLGGRYLELQPGGSDDMIESGGHISYTQAPQNLEQLLGKFIFSMEGTGNGGDSASSESAASQDFGAMPEAETAPAAESP